jgi:hypothetical protein
VNLPAGSGLVNEGQLTGMAGKIKCNSAASTIDLKTGNIALMNIKVFNGPGGNGNSQTIAGTDNFTVGTHEI